VPEPTSALSPFDALLGIRLLEASGARVVAVLDVRGDHHQPHGIIHGGVYASLVESATGVGASLWLGDEGVAVGVSNHTDLLRAVPAGILRVEATPLHQGRLLQSWQADVVDGTGRRVAHGKVTLVNRRCAPPAG
jgi:1,4-dihydroxy-2-naphthoyl-CoA hydrolase